MPTIVPGRILYPKTPLPDPNGVNEKQHGYVVISDVPEIRRGEPFWCVATTSLIRNEHDEVLLVWQKNADCTTKFWKPTVAKVCWHEWAFIDEWTISKGYVKPNIVEQLRILAEQCPGKKSREQTIDSRIARMEATATLPYAVTEGINSESGAISTAIPTNSLQSLRDRVKSKSDHCDPPAKDV